MGFLAIGLGCSVIGSKEIGETSLDEQRSGKAICYFDGFIRNSGFRYCGSLLAKHLAAWLELIRN